MLSPSRFFLLACILALALTGCVRRDAETRAPASAPDTGAGKDGSVWVVDSPKTGGRLFLCGTIHILREADYPLAPGYEAAYANSDRLLFELPPGAGEGPQLVTRMRELGTYPLQEQALPSHLPPATWEAVQKWAQSRGVTPSTFFRQRPWYVALIITSTEYAALGAKPQFGVDNHFEARAKRDGKPAGGLETAEFQLQLFAGLSADQQREMLEQTLAEVAVLPQEYDEMIEAWKTGKLDDLGEMLFREQARFPDLMELFLFGRNRSWMPRLEEILQKGERAMLLVGTGHFAGDKGLIRLLKDKGYTVRHYRDVADGL